MKPVPGPTAKTALEVLRREKDRATVILEHVGQMEADAAAYVDTLSALLVVLGVPRPVFQKDGYYNDVAVLRSFDHPDSRVVNAMTLLRNHKHRWARIKERIDYLKPREL